MQTTEIALQEVNKKQDEIWKTVMFYSLNMHTYTCVQTKKQSLFYN